jgi:transposase-like protein
LADNNFVLVVVSRTFYMVRNTKLTAKQKLQIVIEASQPGATKKGVARRHNVQAGQVRNWIKKRVQL